MSDNQAKTISTAVVWVSVTFLFIFGVFRFNWTGLPAGVLWTAVAVVLAVAPAVATQAIWRQRSPGSDPKGD